MCKRIDKKLNETILIETNFTRSNITTRRSIKWEEIEFPENWIIEQAVLTWNFTKHKRIYERYTREIKQLRIYRGPK